MKLEIKHRYAYTRPVGSQSEVPSISTQEDGSWLIQGYQQYRVSQQKILEAKFEHEKKYSAIASYIPHLKEYRFVDIGCSAGYFGIQALLQGVSHVSFVDHDPEYIDITKNVLLYLSLNNSDCVCSTVSAYRETHDVGFALALVHWIYSYSDTFGSLQAIVAHFAKIAKHTLFIEWIDPDDYAMDLAQHIRQNPERIRAPYSKANFLDALHTHYPTVEYLTTITATRELFIATKLQHFQI